MLTRGRHTAGHTTSRAAPRAHRTSSHHTHRATPHSFATQTNNNNVSDLPPPQRPPHVPQRNVIEMEVDEHSAKPNKSNRLLATMLFKIVVTTLLALWLLAIHSIIAKSRANIEMHAPKVVTDPSSTVTLLGTISVIHDWSKHLLSLLPTFSTSTNLIGKKIKKQVEVGRNMLQIEDAFGSIVACESALHSIVGGIGLGGLLAGVSSSMAQMSSFEGELITEALTCLGQAKLALFSSSYVSQTMKREQLTEAKEIFEVAVSTHTLHDHLHRVQIRCLTFVGFPSFTRLLLTRLVLLCEAD